jgi:hypothetical protein
MSWKKPVLLQHNNVRWHTSAATLSATDSIRFEVVPHPLCSLLWAPSDSCLFASLKKGLRGIPFTYNKGVQAAKGKWFWEQPEVFYSNRLKKPVQWWWPCIKYKGNYVEKWYIETNHKIWAVLCVLLHFNNLSGRKETNMKASLLKHPLYNFRLSVSSTQTSCVIHQSI